MSKKVKKPFKDHRIWWSLNGSAPYVLSGCKPDLLLGLKRGDAASEIMEVVKEKNIDLVVTGSRGHSPIREWMMGSVSRKLVHYSGCSVLVVRQV